MATMPDHALPHCTNPQHPSGLPTRMIYLQTKDHAHVFGCQACRDVNHKLSVRVMTDQFFKREVRKQLAASGQLPKGPMQKRKRSPFELGLMRELSLDAARRNEAARRIDWDSGHRRSKDGKYELVEYKILAAAQSGSRWRSAVSSVPRWMTISPRARSIEPRKPTGLGSPVAPRPCCICTAIHGTR